MKDVMITVRSRQSQPDGSDEDSLELVTEGKYYHDDEKTVISYEESEITGFDGCTTTFSVYPDRIIMNREGNGSGDMIFDRERRHQYYYETPVGSMMLGVVTLSSKIQLHNSGGSIEVHYLLDLDNIVFSRNSFVIDVR